MDLPLSLALNTSQDCCEAKIKQGEIMYTALHPLEKGWGFNAEDSINSVGNEGGSTYSITGGSEPLLGLYKEIQQV